MLAGFDLMKAAATIIQNDYLADMLGDLQPAIQRTYALAIRYSESGLANSRAFFVSVVEAVLARNTEVLPALFKEFGSFQRQLVLDAMAESSNL